MHRTELPYSNKLHPEMLEIIFSFLDNHALLNSMLVNKTWHRLIKTGLLNKSAHEYIHTAEKHISRALHFHKISGGELKDTFAKIEKNIKSHPELTPSYANNVFTFFLKNKIPASNIAIAIKPRTLACGSLMLAIFIGLAAFFFLSVMVCSALDEIDKCHLPNQPPEKVDFFTFLSLAMKADFEALLNMDNIRFGALFFSPLYLILSLWFGIEKSSDHYKASLYQAQQTLANRLEKDNPLRFTP